MEPFTPSSNPSLRVLTRPSSAPALPSSSSDPHLFSNPSSSSADGVVVVGLIARREDDSSHLLNRVLDDNVFGSGNLDARLGGGEGEGEPEAVRDWFRFRKMSYYFEEERGVVFLQFVSNWSLCDGSLDEENARLESKLDDLEFGDLQGMLFMFSVCHVIIFLQEGACFDTQMLKKFRMLQSAKHALVPFIKSHVQPSLTSKYSSTTSLTQPMVGPTYVKSSSSARVGGISNRHSAAISLMSGLGSYPSLFPGQCTPVLLYVFLDNFSEGTKSSSHSEDSGETSSFNQSSNISGLARSSLPMKGSSSVVVLSRPMSKSEGGLRKKLQSSLDAQIRFLIKKCRTLAGSEGSYAGPRGTANSASAPLFSLEASRVVALLDRSSHWKGDSLDFATGLVDEVLKSKATSDTILLENHSPGFNKEDIQSIKEFIYRQSDTLRGRGGMVGNANSGSAAGVGMVAVAAAAAAASVAPGKPISTPELPSLESWLTSSQLILTALLSARHGYLDKSDIVKRKPLRRNAHTTQVEKVVPGGVDPVEAALCWLESGKDLNMKFSTSWCQRALPVAKDIYLKDLPACYPTSLHKAQLEKALHAFHTMVNGPAVQLFKSKLENECMSIWISGRQLCDAVSLTGKPCMHQRHNVEVGDSVIDAEGKPHSSGFVFLHACACGRSRRLCDDPFDFETANITFNHFPDCDDLLPSLQLPVVSRAGPIQSSSWSLIRVGGAKYYQPSKGLLQSGFSSTEKYLFKWLVYLEKPKLSTRLETGVQKGSVISSNKDSKVETSDKEIKKPGIMQVFHGDPRSGVDKQKKNTENTTTDDQKINFGRGLPQFSMRRPFAEVVAGSVATDTAFPPLQQRQQPPVNLEKAVKQKVAKAKSEEHVVLGGQESKKSEDTSSRDSSRRIGDDSYSDNVPMLQIGSYIVPVTKNAGGKIQSSSSLKHVVVYVGFEHECSHGHRFLLSSEHLNSLGSFYSLSEVSQNPADSKTSEREVIDSNVIKSSVHEKMAMPSHNVRRSNRSRQVSNFEPEDGSILLSGSENGREQSSLAKSVNDLGESLQCASLDDGGCASSLLNRNLPLYMNCPHCMNSKDQQKFKFADKLSQLRRIFLVTPPFPTVLATCPVVQFEDSCLPPTVTDREQQSRFSFGCRVILPPDSFLSLSLPFVYGVELDDKSLQSLKPFEHQPELTAWITKGTTLQVLSKESSTGEEYSTYKT